MTSGLPTDALSPAGVAVSEIQSPLGTLLLAAAPLGLTRLAFDDHADAAAPAQPRLALTRQPDRTKHLAQASASLQRYFAGELSRPDCIIDWNHLESTAAALMTTEAIPYASHRSYSELDQNLTAHDLGHAFGANPIPIFTPCHRVGRGTETPTTFVGGTIRRQWLEAHEQAHPLV